jgi:hypothetical protein
VRTLDAATAHVHRRRDDVVDAEELERVHGGHDVDDRVEGANLVQVHLLERHLVDRGLGLGEPAKERHGPLASAHRKGRPANQFLDAGKVAMRVARGIGLGRGRHDADLHRRHARSENAIRLDADALLQPKAPNRAIQLVDRHAGVNERSEQHVAGGAGKTIDVQHHHSSSPSRPFWPS